MVALACAQALGVAALVFFLVTRTDDSSPFDRLMAVTDREGALVAADLLGPGPLTAAVTLCEAGKAPKGQVCTRGACRFAIARQLEKARSLRCAASETETRPGGSVNVQIHCDGASATVGFEPSADGLHGQAEARWPGFLSAL